MATRGTRFDLTPLKRFQRAISGGGGRGAGAVAGAVGGDGEPMRWVFRQWGARYLTFARQRFVRYSRGGGDWKPLAPSTLKQRRGAKRRRTRSRRAHTKTTTRGSARRVAILRDTSTLLNALTIGAPGNLYKLIRKGIRVGFGGPSRHPKGKMTIRDIAVAHDEGQGRLPKRQILVEPDQRTVTGMLSDLRRGVQRLGKRCER